MRLGFGAGKRNGCGAAGWTKPLCRRTGVFGRVWRKLAPDRRRSGPPPDTRAAFRARSAPGPQPRLGSALMKLDLFVNVVVFKALVFAGRPAHGQPTAAVATGNRWLSLGPSFREGLAQPLSHQPRCLPSALRVGAPTPTWF